MTSQPWRAGRGLAAVLLLLAAATAAPAASALPQIVEGPLLRTLDLARTAEHRAGAFAEDARVVEPPSCADVAPPLPWCDEAQRLVSGCTAVPFDCPVPPQAPCDVECPTGLVAWAAGAARVANAAKVFLEGVAQDALDYVRDLLR